MVRVTRMINLDLLSIIKEHKNISKWTLKKLYIKPMPPGVMSSSEINFESDLENMLYEGLIKINDECIEFIKDL
ncbi:hypothetical protein [Clostridium baratii]|uniref:Uncharacterized protein n=1 Tax=Clostridium baratii TaxID=1561 RepID=A0A174QSY9_9CLOT|nr:hypothetical protein [Clostridium baratii]CUP74847.1 Uncharacterised protein [Clostridium baratii]